MPPLVSIVIPTYKRPEKLRRCLESLARLAFSPDQRETIVVDDGSPQTETIAEITQSQALLLRQPNSGPAKARNCGAAAARGHFLAFLDDDCEAEPSWLATLLAHAQPRLALATHTHNLAHHSPCAHFNQRLLDALDNYCQARQPRWAFLTTSNLLLVREEFLALGGFDTSMPLAGGEDREFCARWLAHGGSLKILPHRLVGHNHAQSVSQFLRMHYRYGRGAAQLRLRHNLGPLDRQLFPYLWRQTGFSWRFPLCQAATTLGYLAESISSSSSPSTTCSER